MSEPCLLRDGARDMESATTRWSMCSTLSGEMGDPMCHLFDLSFHTLYPCKCFQVNDGFMGVLYHIHRQLSKVLFFFLVR